MNARLFLMMSVLLVALAACSLPAQVAPDMSEADIQATVAVMLTQTAPATGLQTPVAPDPNALLPAPLYFVGDDGQLWRLERDGQTRTQVTNEPEEVVEYDVSPAEGSLVYLTSNSLIVTDALGGNRRVLVQGVAVDYENFDYGSQMAEMLSRPRWSPDGRQIAYGHNGIRVISAEGGEPTMVLQSDDYPTDLSVRLEVPPMFYHPNSWSPNGRYLLIDAAFFMEGGTLAFLDMSTGQLANDLVLTNGLPCCNPVWLPDSSGVIYGTDMMGMVRPGLFRADVSQPEVVVIDPGEVPNSSEPIFHLFSHPVVMGDYIYYFGQRYEGYPEFLQPHPMMRADLDGNNRTVLREALVNVLYALWSPNVDGAVVVTYTNDYQVGELLWVPVGDGPTVVIGQPGHWLKWGK